MRPHRARIADALAICGRIPPKEPAMVEKRSCLPSLALLVLASATGTEAAEAHRAAWMQKARWGVMTHYLPDWIEQNKKWSSDEWNTLVDGFDVEALAKQLESVGAGYYLITIGSELGLLPGVEFDVRQAHRDPTEPVLEARPRLGSPGGAEQARYPPARLSAVGRSEPGRRGQARARMDQRSPSEPGVSGQVGGGRSRLVAALRTQDLGLVVRRLLLAEPHVPRRSPELRNARRGRSRRQSRQHGRLQPRRVLPGLPHEPAPGLPCGRDQRCRAPARQDEPGRGRADGWRAGPHLELPRPDV